MRFSNYIRGIIIKNVSSCHKFAMLYKRVGHTFQGKYGKEISKGHWQLADLVICFPADIIFKQNIEETSEHF